METERKDKVENHHKFENGGYFVKTKNDEGTDNDERSKTNRMPSKIGVFIFTESKRLMN